MISEILNYDIIRKIGEGGMGEVYLARNKSIHQFVAIKMLHPHYSANPVLRNRFRDEAIMLSSLNHPNIVKFLNYVENEHGVFLIMEYVDGMTIEDFINTKNGLIVEETALPMFRQILDAVDYAHERGIVHRDLKPGNILLTEDGRIKILDFGIAQIMHDSNEDRFNNSGSIEYMSPEQIAGRPVDVRSDIYALGVLFFQMLTGKPPYSLYSMSTLEIKNAILNDPLEPMSNTYEYISDNIQGVVWKATNKRPEDRFASCKDMKQAIIGLRVDADGQGFLPYSPESDKKKKGNSVLFISIAITLLICLLGGAAWWYFANQSGVRFYDEYVEQWGLPVGIGERLKGEKDVLYRIEFDAAGRPLRLSRVNSEGHLVALDDTLMNRYKMHDAKYVYDTSGKLDYKTVYDNHGHLLYKVDYDDDFCEAEVTRGSDSIATEYYKLYYDKNNGRLERLIYTDKKEIPVKVNGVYGEKYSYDNNGRLVRVSFVDSVANPMTNRQRVATIFFDYSAPDKPPFARTFDLKGRPVEPLPATHVPRDGKRQHPRRPSAKKEIPRSAKDELIHSIRNERHRGDLNRMMNNK